MATRMEKKKGKSELLRSIEAKEEVIRQELKDIWDLSHFVGNETNRFDYVLEVVTDRKKSESERHKLDAYQTILEGTGLTVDVKIAQYTKKEHVFFQITASYDMLLRMASHLRLSKPRRLRIPTTLNIDRAVFRESDLVESVPFDYTFRDEFVGVEDELKFLSSQDRQQCVHYLIMSARITKENQKEMKSLLGGAASNVGASVVSEALRIGTATQLYCLHMEAERLRLSKVWAERSPIKSVTSLLPFVKGHGPPKKDIRHYLGDKITFFVQWMQMYQGSLSYLVIPALVIHMVLRPLLWLLGSPISEEVVYFAHFVTISLWGPLFIELSRRGMTGRAFRWGTLNVKHREIPRAEYRGTMRKSPVTGREELYSPFWIHVIRTLVGWGILILLLVAKIALDTKIFSMEKYFQENYHPRILVFVYRPLYGVVIDLGSTVYSLVSDYLHRWENYKTETNFENAKIRRRFAFEFCNSYLSLFYFAFVERDMVHLKEMLVAVVITKQIIGTLKSSVLPYFIFRYKVYRRVTQWKAYAVGMSQDYQFTQVDTNAMLESCDEDMISDYIQPIIQFGYICMFGAIWSWIPVVALFNNELMMRAVAWKFCHAVQRPRGKLAEGIGVWQGPLRLLSITGVIVNASLLLQEAPVVHRMISAFVEFTLGKAISPLLAMVLVEHAVIALILLIHSIIESVTPPGYVRKELARLAYVKEMIMSAILQQQRKKE